MAFPDIDRLGFSFSPEHREIRSLMLRFGADRLLPGSAERDRTHSFPVEQIGELAALGAMAMKTPATDDGPGIDNVGYALSIEALSRYDASVAVVMVASNLTAAIMNQHANSPQRERFLKPLARGELGHVAFALTEPHAGSDAGAIRTTAVRDADHWVLNGTKQWITGASDARVFIVFAKTPAANGEPLISCFIVEAGTPGFSIGRIEDKMGLRSSGTAELLFDNCRVSQLNQLGDDGKGFQIALAGIAPSRIAIAAQSIGIAERAFELGLSYASDRKAFGKSLVEFQHTRFVLADCRAELDQAWLLMLRAATLLDRGIPVRSEASMAKLVASEACSRIVDHMLQLHGGNGYSSEYEIERLYRDARVMRIFEGTSEIQREVIARELV